jgi:hypothetical protein
MKMIGDFNLSDIPPKPEILKTTMTATSEQHTASPAVIQAQDTQEEAEHKAQLIVTAMKANQNTTANDPEPAAEERDFKSVTGEDWNLTLSTFEVAGVAVGLVLTAGGYCYLRSKKAKPQFL